MRLRTRSVAIIAWLIAAHFGAMNPRNTCAASEPVGSLADPGSPADDEAQRLYDGMYANAWSWRSRIVPAWQEAMFEDILMAKHVHLVDSLFPVMPRI